MRLPDNKFKKQYYEGSEAIERLIYPRFIATLRNGELTIVEELETDKDFFYEDELKVALEEGYLWLNKNSTLMSLFKLNEDEAISSLINEEVKAIRQQL